MVNELPADHPDRARYITLFREMAEKISAVQGECSIGRATKETVTRGWSAMVKAVHPDGMLGWVQRIGDQPGATGEHDRGLWRRRAAACRQRGLQACDVISVGDCASNARKPG